MMWLLLERCLDCAPPALNRVRGLASLGFDDVAEASMWQPSLTTVATGRVNIGELVAQLMLKRIANPDMPIEQVIIPPRLIQRDSTVLLV